MQQIFISYRETGKQLANDLSLALGARELYQASRDEEVNGDVAENAVFDD